jgi:hypothetical protein
MHSVGLACYGRPGPAGNRPMGPKPPARARHSTRAVTARNAPMVAQRSAVTQRPRCGGSSDRSTREGKGTRRARGGAEGLTECRGDDEEAERARSGGVQWRRRGCSGRRRWRHFPATCRSGGGQPTDDEGLGREELTGGGNRQWWRLQVWLPWRRIPTVGW